MKRGVLIIGEDPAQIDFDALDAPPGMSAEKVMQGLTSSRDRLVELGHRTEILLIRDGATLEAQVEERLHGQHFSIIVIGAGLRTLPSMAGQFEQLMNALHRLAPSSAFAFNSRPDDSAEAALRHVT